MRTTVGRERPERERVAGRERRRRRPVLGAGAEVAGAEDDGGEALRRRRRASERAAGEAHLDRRAAREVTAAQARGQGRGVVGDDQVAGTSRSAQRAARMVRAMRPAPSTTSRRASRGRCTGRVGGLHARAPAARPQSRRPSALAVDARGELARRVARPLQRRRVGVGHGERRAAACPCRPGRRDDARCRAAAAPRPRSGSGGQRRLARAVGAPAGIGRDRGVARDVEHHERAPSRRRRAPTRRAGRAAPWSGGTGRAGWWRAPPRSPRSRCRRAGRSGTGPRLEALLTRTSRPPSAAADLQRDRVDVVLAGDVADDAVAAGDPARDARDARRRRGRRRRPRRRARRRPRRGRRPRPEVPPVTATRSGVREEKEVCHDGSVESDGAKVGAARQASAMSADWRESHDDATNDTDAWST